MSDDASPPKWYTDGLAKGLDARGDLPPPWARCPEIPFGSIGWRMGYGESWLMLWWRWLEGQPADRESRLRYLRRHPAAPRPWAVAVASVLEPGTERDDIDDAHVARLRAEGLVGDDVAQAAWELRQGPTPAAPWMGPSRTMADCARYGARELTLWARWCGRQREAGTLDAWFSATPPPPPEWSTMADAVRTGRPPPEPMPADAWEQLALQVSARGWPPPPWELGEPPDALQDDYDDDASYADAWSSWVGEAIDDAGTWDAYVDACGPIPPQWHEPIARSVWFGE